MNATNATNLWIFSESFNEERRAKLASVGSFDDVIYLIENSIHSIHVASCRGRSEGLEAYVQPVFTASISEEAFDSFFNAPVGYRARYLHDPHLGLAANLALIGALEGRLQAAATHAHIPELDTIDVRRSIQAASCKVWVHEEDFPFGSLTVDLAVEPWVAAAAAGNKLAKWGLCAPVGTRIQIKGALLSPLGNEAVPRKKVLRRFEIHQYGFS